MLEKQKELVREKWKQGKEVLKKISFPLGVVAGVVGMIGLEMLERKIWESSELSVQTTYNKNLEEPNFGIQVRGTGIFGRELTSPLVRYEYAEKDRERIVQAIDGAINREKSRDF